MKANELKLGNYIYTYINGYRCLCIAKSIDESGLRGWDFIEEVKDETNLTDFYITEPIPLTEEWLIKFGFVAKNQGYLCENKKVYLSDDFFYYCLYFDCEDAIQIKHVHSLQNLYFALTNEELKIEKL